MIYYISFVCPDIVQHLLCIIQLYMDIEILWRYIQSRHDALEILDIDLLLMMIDIEILIALLLFREEIPHQLLIGRIIEEIVVEDAEIAHHERIALPHRFSDIFKESLLEVAEIAERASEEHHSLRFPCA